MIEFEEAGQPDGMVSGKDREQAAEEAADSLDQFLQRVGRKIGEIRSQKGNTQVQFAKKVGVCAQMVQYWESGRNITLKTLYRLSGHLDCPVESFLMEGPAKADPGKAEPPLESKLGSLGPDTVYGPSSPLPNEKLLLRMNLASWFPSKERAVVREKLRVLVVEDNPFDLNLLKEVFRQEGGERFELVHEPSLSGALARLAWEKVDLILLDLFLPETAGLETIAEIQKISSGTPLIILTGLYDDLMASHALRMGADFFLPKGLPEINALAGALHDYAGFK